MLAALSYAVNIRFEKRDNPMVTAGTVRREKRGQRRDRGMNGMTLTIPLCCLIPCVLGVLCGGLSLRRSDRNSLDFLALFV